MVAMVTNRLRVIGFHLYVMGRGEESSVVFLIMFLMSGGHTSSTQCGR